MPGTSPDKLSLICIELKMIDGHPVADLCYASLELTDHTSYNVLHHQINSANRSASHQQTNGSLPDVLQQSPQGQPCK